MVVPAEACPVQGANNERVCKVDCMPMSGSGTCAEATEPTNNSVKIGKNRLNIIQFFENESERQQK